MGCRSFGRCMREGNSHIENAEAIVRPQGDDSNPLRRMRSPFLDENRTVAVLFFSQIQLRSRPGRLIMQCPARDAATRHLLRLAGLWLIHHHVRQLAPPISIRCRPVVPIRRGESFALGRRPGDRPADAAAGSHYNRQGRGAIPSPTALGVAAHRRGHPRRGGTARAPQRRAGHARPARGRADNHPRCRR